ncbi:winged helix DNA-binding domain-containing protein [Methanocella sp. MCL-LM]|uniref:winged helix DNA-binding domain-containing protein n=1 Tax=Methanocella sp. MCL-LM TaxID=3412035 RepID=UPI003C78E80A
MKVFSAPTVNAHILEKQMLGNVKAATAEEAVKRLVAIDSGSLPNTCYSLSLRVKNFNPAAFQNSLSSGKLARIRGLKGNLQVIPTDLMPAVYAASAESREARAKSLLQGWGIGEEEYGRVRTAIIEGLGTKEKTLPQLKNGLKPGVSRDLVRTKGKKKERSTNVAVVATAMWERWELLRGGTGRAPCEDPGRYSLFSRRFGKMKLDMDRHEAVKKLAGQYVAAYGPVSAEDIAWWLGIPVKEALSVLDRKAVEQVEVEGITGEFFAAAGPEIGDIRPGSGIVMLAADDPYVKAYARRERFVPSLYLDRMITRFGESVSTVLIGGAVAGTWHIDREMEGDLVDVELFGPVAEGSDERLERAADEAGGFFTGDHMPVRISVYKR